MHDNVLCNGQQSIAISNRWRWRRPTRLTAVGTALFLCPHRNRLYIGEPTGQLVLDNISARGKWTHIFTNMSWSKSVSWEEIFNLSVLWWGSWISSAGQPKVLRYLLRWKTADLHLYLQANPPLYIYIYINKQEVVIIKNTRLQTAKYLKCIYINIFIIINIF